MALHVDEGTYVAHEWKDQPDDYTPMTPEVMNHMEQGIQDNSEDIKELRDSVSPVVTYKLASGVSVRTALNVIIGKTVLLHMTVTKSGNFASGEVFATIDEKYRPAYTDYDIVFYGNNANDYSNLKVQVNNVSGALSVNSTAANRSTFTFFGIWQLP